MSHASDYGGAGTGPILGTICAIFLTWGAALYEWVIGAGLLSPATFCSLGGLAIGFIVNYAKLRENAPRLWADLKAAHQRIRGKA